MLISHSTLHPCTVYVFLHNVQSSAVICGSQNEAHKREMNGHKAPCAESQGNLHGGSLTRRDPKCVKLFNGSLSGCEFCPLQRSHVDHRDFILSPLDSSMTHRHRPPSPLFSPLFWNPTLLVEHLIEDPRLHLWNTTCKSTKQFYIYALLFENVRSCSFETVLTSKRYKNTNKLGTPGVKFMDGGHVLAAWPTWLSRLAGIPLKTQRRGKDLFHY